MTGQLEMLTSYGYPKRPCDTSCIEGCKARANCPLYRAWCIQTEIDTRERKRIMKLNRSSDKKLSHSQFGQKVSKILKDKGCWLFNVHGERMQKRGVPDLLVIGLTWKGFLEFKTGDAKCKDIQKVQIEKLKKRKFPCYVLRYMKELNCIQIENQNGVVLNLVAWEALWNWLKKPIIVSSSSTDDAKLNLYDKYF